MDKILLTDCDGVLLDWLKGFCSFMSEKGFKIKDSFSYKLETAFNLKSDEINNLIVEFNMSDNMVSLPPIFDAKECLSVFKKAGYKIICISSMSDNENSQNKRIKNLKNVFGDDTFSNFHFLKLHASKKPILNLYSGKKAIWVEDHVQNAIDGATIGFKTFLLNHSYNDNAIFDDKYNIEKVVCWKEILRKVFDGTI